MGVKRCEGVGVVAILIVLEDSYGAQFGGIAQLSVAILIVLEDSYGEEEVVEVERSVAILIVLEDSYGEEMRNQFGSGRNPYCIGG